MVWEFIGQLETIRGYRENRNTKRSFVTVGEENLDENTGEVGYDPT